MLWKIFPTFANNKLPVYINNDEKNYYTFAGCARFVNVGSTAETN